MKIVMKSFFLFFAMCFAGDAYAGPASAKLSGLAESLIKGYAAKAGPTKTTLAVFPFTCDPKLEKQRVGFAASELMSHRFVADGNFMVVERGEIGKILSEQKLQASGAVDSATAVRIGKVLGAGTILPGNIQKVDGKYQVNARLVNAETSEVLVSGYEELDVSAFEDDARVYLSLVPETQTLGLYFLYNMRSNSNDLPAQTFTDPYLGSQTVAPKSFSLGMIGGGIRYAPTAGTQVDLAYMGNGAGVYIDNGLFGHMQVTVLRGLFGLRLKKTKKFTCYAGGGASSYSLDWIAKTTYHTPTAFIRLEFLPQSRIGISISGSYDLYGQPAKQKLGWLNPPLTIKGGKLNKFSIEPTLSVYF